MQFAKLQSYCSPQQPNWQCSREPSWRMFDVALQGQPAHAALDVAIAGANV
jgi:hypothetical protein